MKNILITGATGFVGKHVVNAFTDTDTKIRAVVRRPKDNGQISQKGIDEVIETNDLFAENENWWADICKDIDIIIHLAWYAEPGKYLQSSKNIDCLSGTLQLAKGAVSAGVKRFVGIGTCFEYDLSDGLLSTDTPLKPLTPYAGAKVATYSALSQYLPEEKMEFLWGRLFYLYGEGEDMRRLVPFIKSRLSEGKVADLTSGNQIRDFLDVKDAAQMIAELALGNEQGAINICSGEPITVRQLAEKIADEYGRRDLLNFGARANNYMDPPKVVGVL